MIDIGYQTVKEVVDFVSQDAAHFFGFLLVAGIATEFTIRITKIIVVDGIVKLLKVILNGIGKAFDHLTREKEEKK